ncbi:cobalt chelatase [Polaromonas sp. CG_23.6]|uniref:cobaltochelatase CobT-related protein n=1 Tax=unclassified Polaromonas TaxID=2638319 RepID=UPI0018CBBF57|nr:cobalt chelatase [Polaromonas sp. CG_23.6]MBG6072419.1 cobaltochelatase CobT [Polaromonas sp. CG_9.7]MBG6114423.1 cobaltochelatase CobT [Polaromonas sp. CG_9.2]MDH6185377.1 cobaltochelatase CobT [Polaromonas sp. CG_23.6]
MTPTPVDVQAASRQQQRVEELCAASIRAISGEADLHFRGRRLHRGEQALPLFAPHLSPSLETDDFGSFRGAADGMALRLAHSNADLHQNLSPVEPLARMLFEILEQFRCEALATPDMPGLVRNLRHRHEQWSLAFHHSGLTESTSGVLLYTVAQICRARVTAEPVLHDTEDFIEATRMSLAPKLGHNLSRLRRTRFDQEAYAPHALAIARAVSDMVHSTQEAGDDQRDTSEEDRSKLPRNAFQLWTDFDNEEAGEGIATPASGNSRVLEESEDGYRVFTMAYDREVRASELVRAELLREYRERLDQRIAGQGIHVARLARQLKALLAVPTRDGWDGGQEEGYIDGRQLAQLVASPTERRLFRIERHEAVSNSQVNFLIDCSGSMREHIESVAMIVDVLVRALEQAGVDNEVLGFTTGAWNGGRARRDWLRAGRPANPGRLNEACHMVFKNADTPWRRARPDIAALLKADLFREGVDGEAVNWACQRMQGRSEGRRLLIVISDGCPMDGATHQANDQHYLDHHLRQVVAHLEQSGQAEIFGVGVGLDLSPYYSKSQALDLSASVTNEVFRDIFTLIASQRRR